MRAIVLSAISHAPRRFFHYSIPRFGIMDTMYSLVDRATAGTRSQLAESADAKNAEKLEEMWRLQLDFLVKSPTYTISDHSRLLSSILDKATAGTTGWRSMLLTDATKANLADSALDVRIGEAFTEDEIAGHAKTRGSLASPIDAGVRARVAASVGTDLVRVSKFLASYRQSSTMHGWLQGRKAKGLALPSTPEQYAATMMADKVGSSQREQRQNMQGKKFSVRNSLRKSF